MGTVNKYDAPDGYIAVEGALTNCAGCAFDQLSDGSCNTRRCDKADRQDGMSVIFVKRTDAGGPAFPFQELNSDGSPYSLSTGMTLRDYFAAKAMQGILSSDVIASKSEFAAESYAMADAMLKARDAR